MSLPLCRFPGLDILAETLRRSVPMLWGPSFFFGALVLICGAAVYYLEPCYQYGTCPFQDVFQAAFYALSTVTTVGYGQQVSAASEQISRWSIPTVLEAGKRVTPMYLDLLASA
jgi:hypothetical protein